MPKRDVIMTLVDEEEEESQAKYLAQKNGLSGGWRGFAIDHQLVDGDAVVFHLIARTTFKVKEFYLEILKYTLVERLWH